MKKEILHIDGSFGEGGGQIIRTALALSMITGTPIHITNIRAGRKKSGLMRQHLVCVQASQQICHASVQGAELGSQELHFSPQSIMAGKYEFNIGSAGSTNLVLQTILPALLTVEQPSEITLTGGTHNPFAPSSDFIQHAFIPALAKMDIHLDYRLLQAGFAPVGGGKITVNIQPLNEQSPILFQQIDKGKLYHIDIIANELNLDIDILKREIDSCKQYLIKKQIPHDKINTQFRTLKGIGEGNNCFAIVKFMDKNQQIYQDVLDLLGEKKVSAESIGKRLGGLIARLVNHGGCFDEYLTDQLLLPMALTGGGSFTSRFISEHTRTQAVMIEKFLPVTVSFEQVSDNIILVMVKNNG